MKRSWSFLVSMLVVALLTGVVSSCAKPPPTPTSTTTTPAPASAPASKPTPTATPTAPAPSSTSTPVSFAGKTLTVVIPNAAGGGTDVWGRVLVKHLPRFLPGNPIIVVRNMEGAGGITGLNYVYEQVKPDGLTFAATASAMFRASLGAAAIRYDLLRMPVVFAQPLGSVFLLKSDVIKQPKDIVNAKGLVYGDADIATGLAAVLANGILGLDVKHVFGYKSSGDKRRGFLKGEFNYVRELTSGYFPNYQDLVKTGEVVIPFVSGLLDSKRDVVRDSSLPEVLTLKELYVQVRGKSPAGIAWDTYRWMLGTYTLNKAVHLPPNIPSDIEKVYTEAFVKMAADPQFIKDIGALTGGAQMLVGQDVKDMLRVSMTISPEVRQYAIKVLEEYGMKFK